MTTHNLYAIHGNHDLTYPGWVVLTQEIGHDPTNHSGADFWQYSNEPIVRLNNGYGSAGTIPPPALYEAFAQRVANFVAASNGCNRWIIGNEPNMAVERPGGQPITPADYARCYDLCRAAIHALPEHANDEVLVAAIAPWNVETGPWLAYFEDIQHEIAGADGFALHTYARAQTPASITDPARMDPPYEFAHNGFQHYTDWMAAILPAYRGLPVYLTEFCIAGVPWMDANTGCVCAAYQEIDRWNRAHDDLPILCLAVYRWEYDQWAIWNKPGVITDFYEAVEEGYAYPPGDDPQPPEEDTMLQNPSFEGGWHNQTQDGILVLPDGWACEYQEGDHPYKRPEIKPNTEFQTNGIYSVRAFPPAHSRGFYGIWQEVEAEAGAWYKFSADVRIESEPSGENAAFCGIQPWGAGIFERQMIWGKETQIKREWTRIGVIAQAFGGKIRVVMGATNKWATQNNTTWWDNAQLEIWECDGGTEPEPPDPPDPGEPCEVDYGRIAQIVRAELDMTVWASGTA